MSKTTARRGRAIATTSWLALGVAMAWTPALAQSAPANDSNGNTVADVIVVGARASQQSSIDRKKRAATPTDSIVADDVGSFPDRSITEAISRVAGTALNRNDFGEGEGVSIRGATMDQTRIELDGMGVQSTYGLALGNSRAADMRELPSDLIKSVDIVKGSTADMTEGSLSGSVKIQTRTGLDFKKPYVSLRLGYEQNSVDEKWTPDFNLVASRKFLDGRLGVIFNGSYRAVRNVSHTQETAGSNGNAGYAELWDWDNSAEKSYTYRPELVGGPQGDVVFANSTETPRSLLTKSAAAQSKFDCLKAFPYIDSGVNPRTNYVAGEPNPAGGGNLSATQAANLNTANNALITTANNNKNQRLNEQQTCLNQWNDMAPNLIRSFMNSQEDKRDSLDFRVDYRVSDSLTVFAKVNHSERITDDQNRFRTLGNPDVNPGPRLFTTNGTATQPAQRYVVVDSPTTTNPVGSRAGYFTWTLDNLFPKAPSCPSVSTPSQACDFTTNPMMGRGNNNSALLLSPADQVAQANYTDDFSAGQSIPLRGMVTNIDPASVKVDKNHNVTSFTMYNNSLTINQIDNYQPSKTDYAQIGGDYDHDRMRIEFMAGMTKATSTRLDMRTERRYNYGQTTLTLSPSGVWDYDLTQPQGSPAYDDTKASNFVQLSPPLTAQAAQALSPTNQYATPAYAIAQLPNVSPSFPVTMRPRAAEATEKVAKIDLTYDLSDFSPFLTRLKTGVNFRNNVSNTWGGGGATIRDAVGTFGTAGYIPAIVLPGNNLDGSYRACEETSRPVRAPGTNGPTDPGDLGGSLQQRDGIKGGPAPYLPAGEPADQGLCNYGFVLRNPNSRSGVDTLTPQQLTQLYTDTIEDTDMRFFNSYKTSAPGWNGLDTGKLFSMLGAGQYTNLDCIKYCTASDGQVYAQPVNIADESTIAAYAMLDFEAEDLPFGMSLTGNVGIRGVHVETKSTGQMTLQHTRVVTANPLLLDTRTFRQNVALSRETIDWLPSYNVALWVIPDQVVVRYSYGKQISRPNINQLVPAGTCIIDERNDPNSGFFDGDEGDTCSGTIGNPGLDPQRAINQQVNLEWYPNRDTTVSLAWQKSDIKTGGARTIAVEQPLFHGSGLVDPVTQKPLDDLIFRYNTFDNGPGFERTGLEFTAKTAFTFLPWLFRYTGADFNYSTLKASNATGGEYDPITGDLMDPRGQSAYYTNLSLWYDDGRAQVRVSYQARAQTFNGITPLSGDTSRNFPTSFSNGVAPPYYPGQPRFTDETKFLDAKASYNINDNVQVYLEGTNLTKQAQTASTGEYRSYEDGTPAIMRIAYSGMRIRTGVTFKFQ